MAGLERLGETTEFRVALLQLLSAAGWTVIVTSGFAECESGGVIVRARRGHLRTPKRHGASLVDVALQVFEDAMKLEGRWVEAA